MNSGNKYSAVMELACKSAQLRPIDSCVVEQKASAVGGRRSRARGRVEIMVKSGHGIK